MVNIFKYPVNSFWLLPGRCLLCRQASERQLDLCLACESLLLLNQTPTGVISNLLIFEGERRAAELCALNGWYERHNQKGQTTVQGHHGAWGFAFCTTGALIRPQLLWARKDIRLYRILIK